MGLFDKFLNDGEKQKEEAAKRKAAEEYARTHSHPHESEHAEPPKHTETQATHTAAPAKKAAAKPAAESVVEVKATVKKVTAKKAVAEAAPTRAPAATIHHQGHTTAGAVTVAHDQAMTIHLLSHIPDHAPREDDPHYHLFEQAKSRLKRQGLWQCMINDDLCDGVPELHHTFIEFSQINEVDPAKVQKALGLHFDTDEDFQVWAESPGNLEVLCSNHHRAHYGIHVIPGPLWEALRFRKANTAAAAEVVTNAELAEQEKKAKAAG
jgi:hypothetical protein